MDWNAEWANAQQTLSTASRNEQWWRSLPTERRNLLGRGGYRGKCRAARLAVKVADDRCRALIATRRDAGRTAERHSGSDAVAASGRRSD